MKCQKRGTNKIAVCKSCRHQGVPDPGAKTKFELFTQSPEMLADGLVCNRNGMWEFIWHDIAIIRKETREAAVAMAIEYLKQEVD